MWLPPLPTCAESSEREGELTERELMRKGILGVFCVMVLIIKLLRAAGKE